MMGWLIAGAGVLFLASRNSIPTPVQMLPPVALRSRNTGQVLAAATPALPVHSWAAAPVILSGGNEPLIPLSADAAKTIQKDAIATYQGGIQFSLATEISAEKAMGTYTGYGVPLSGPGFAPLASTDQGTFIIDSGSVGFSAGPLAG